MREFELEITINKPASEIFDYVTRPAKWFEWFPSSRASEIEDAPQIAGDKFSMVTVQKPIKRLPFKIQKIIDYEVVECTPPSVWRIVASSASVDTNTFYELREHEGVTRFRRLFAYQAKGLFAALEPLLFRRAMMNDAEASLKNLKLILESRI